MPIIMFLRELMETRKRRPTQLAREIGVSHVTVLRWLTGEDCPTPKNCVLLAEYSGVPAERILVLAGHIPGRGEAAPETLPAPQWPKF